jgi:putative adhesin
MERLKSPGDALTQEAPVGAKTAEDRRAEAAWESSAPERPIAPSEPMYSTEPPPAPSRGVPPLPPGGMPPYGSRPATPGSLPWAPRRRSNAWIWWLVGGVLGVFVLLGLIAALIGSLIGAWVGSVGGPRYTVESTQTFAVTGAPHVVVRDTAGNITLRSGDAGKVTVHVTKVVRGLVNESAQRRTLDDLTVATTRSGDTINVTADFATNVFDGTPGHRTVDLLITVPAGANVAVTAAAGNIDMTHIAGVYTIDAAAGNITIRDATFADGSRLSAAAGNVTLEGALASGASMDVSVSAGNVDLRLPEQTHATLDARVSAGNVTVHGWSIPVTRSSVVGANATGPLGSDPHGTVRVSVATGNIDIRQR